MNKRGIIPRYIVLSHLKQFFFKQVNVFDQLCFQLLVQTARLKLAGHSMVMEVSQHQELSLQLVQIELLQLEDQSLEAFKT